MKNSGALNCFPVTKENTFLKLPFVLPYRIISYYFHVYSPAERQGGEKLLVRLIKLFSSTVIFSKRRKISTHVEGEPEWTLRWRILALDWKQRTKAYGTPVPKKTTTIYGVRMHVSAPGEVESLR